MTHENRDSQAKWSGVFPAATTQFKPDGSLDVPATLTHLDVMLDGGGNILISLFMQKQGLYVGTQSGLEFVMRTS